MNKITAKAILGELLEAYEQYEHGDYFYDNGDVVCEAVECVLSEQESLAEKQATSDKTSDESKRLIYADDLKKKAFPDPDSGEGMVYVQDVDEAPTVDAMEVVRNMWIPVTDRLPEHCVTVLSYNGVCIGTDFYDKGFELWCSEIEQSFHMVTHWMPLPEVPKGECS